MPSLDPSDRQSITDLLATYSFALDQRDWDALRGVFTADASISYPGLVAGVGPRTYAGADAILDFFRSSLDRAGATQHLMHTSIVRSTGTDRADGTTYNTAHHLAIGARPPVSTDRVFTVTGRYNDQFVKDAGQWRISRRELALITTTGDLAILKEL